jgi:hypothetical protein
MVAAEDVRGAGDAAGGTIAPRDALRADLNC